MPRAAALTLALSVGLSMPTAAEAQHDVLGHLLPDSARLSTADLHGVTNLLAGFVADGKIAGAVAAVARDGRLGYLQAVGFQDLETRTPMTARSLFRIYSMTKPITAVAVMMLHEEGKFELSDPVATYLPEFRDVRVFGPAEGETRPPARPVTIEDLLLHTSGLNHRTSELYRNEQVRSRSDDLPPFVTKIASVPLMEDPGTRFRYSESSTVLGRLVEIWSGRPFDAFLDERIFRPLGMIDTGFHVGPGEVSRLATVYRSVDGRLAAHQIEEVPFTEEDALPEGAVGLVSTVPDFLRFAQMLLNRGELNGIRLLESSTVDAMTRNGLSDQVLALRAGATGWGLGNVTVLLEPDRLDYPANAGEYGWDGSAGTVFWIDPTFRTITVLMLQSSPAFPDSLRQRFRRALDPAILR
ncbi:MAG: serine hydrolase domain-containing protein [Gemmatimonadota bacterium]